MKLKFWLVFLVALQLLVAHFDNVHAQSTLVSCGDVVQGEFTEKNQPIWYEIDMNAGDELTISGTTRGDNLRYAIEVQDPTGHWLVGGNFHHSCGSCFTRTPLAEPGVLDQNGIHKVRVWNGSVGGGGVYILSFICTPFENEDITPPTLQPSPSPPAFGFPGLAPVDFSTASPLPLSVGGGTITPGNSEITAFNFEANAGDMMALDFTRLAGNLNLGLVVLSSSNEVVFQASLVTSESLSTRLTLPSAGQYTIGVFRIDLLPPANPEATAFQVTGTLHP